MKNLKKIKGDASVRKFYRKKNDSFNSIVVFAKKDKLKNLLVYDAINKIFIKNNILAPALYLEKYNKGYLEIQDFGNNTVLRILKYKKKNKLLYFKRIVKILIKIQSIKNRQIKNFKNKNYIIPKYNKKILIEEAELFCDWYVKKNMPVNKRSKFNKKFKMIIRELSLNLKLKNNIFVHRDFHISNLMVVNEQIGVIDSQDALIGNKAYDLASLIDDVRFETSQITKDKIYNYYLKGQKKLDKSKFKNDFEILSILRNLKIIGIFTRLAFRENKKNYLKFIPYTWRLINMRIKDNEKFKDLRILLSQNFKKKIK
ncbi:phosphotransferase [Pelagibacterales bacterium SAG-MED47]|nr:phosphotransferase [Pelagibacterales bacterium SAG-MED47]